MGCKAEIPDLYEARKKPQKDGRGGVGAPPIGTPGPHCDPGRHGDGDGSTPLRSLRFGVVVRRGAKVIALATGGL